MSDPDTALPVSDTGRERDRLVKDVFSDLPPEPPSESDARLHERGWFGEHEALWADPQPVTPEGQHLWRLFAIGALGTSPSGIRDFGQRICQIESESEASQPASPVTPDLDAVRADLVGQPCGVIHGGYPPGTTCLDRQREAASGEGRYANEWRATVASGVNLCFRCKVRAALATEGEAR